MSKTSSDSQHWRAGFYSHVSPTHWQGAPSWPPVAACVSSSVDLGFPARLDGQQQPHFIPWYTVAHGGDPDACFMSRWACYLPHPSSARRLPPSGPRTARPPPPSPPLPPSLPQCGITRGVIISVKVLITQIQDNTMGQYKALNTQFQCCHDFNESDEDSTLGQNERSIWRICLGEGE